MAFLARADYQLTFIFLIIFPLLAFRKLRATVTRASLFILRLRWFWLSIALLYGLMTPGESLLVVSSHLIVTKTGLFQGLERCLGLIVVLLYFSLLTSQLTATQWQDALYWMVSPLRFLGISVEKISLRLSLTMQVATEIQKKLATNQKKQSIVRSIRQLPDWLSDLFNQALVEADAQMVVDTEIELLSPRLWEWMIPLILFGMLWLLNRTTLYPLG